MHGCTSDKEGNKKDNYICSSNKWKKCANIAKLELDRHYCDGTSWFTCDETTKDEVTEDKKYSCNGVSWESCTNSNEGTTTTNNQYACFDDKWQTCTAEIELEEKPINNEVACFNSLWNTCDGDNAGTVTPNYQYYCDGKDWRDDFHIDNKNFYEVKVVKGTPWKNIITDINDYPHIELCDKETEAFLDKATLCYDPGDKTLELASLNYLNSGAKKPNATNNVLFIYGEPSANEKKSVSVILLQDLTNSPVIIPSGNFAKNLIAGQRLGLKLPTDADNYEYYLLSHEPAELFDFNKLTITHLPTKAKYTPTLIPANNYQFTVLADKAITITQQSGEIKITIDVPGEAPAAYPIPFSLINKSEVPFSTSEPVKLTNLNNILLTVCTDDNPADQLTLLVCLNDQHTLTLEKDVLTNATIGGKEVALLYQISTNEDGTQKKQGSIFHLEKLSDTNKPLNFNNYVDNMVAGRRLALEFEKQLYLMEHPIQQFLSLPALNLVKYLDSGSVIYPATGSEKKVDFLISEGKVILERNFGTPPPPFQIKALTKQQIVDTPLDLKKELFTSMSNQIPVQISDNPEFGIISVAESDLTGYDASFKLTTTKMADYHLNYQIPKVFDDAPSTLFYYFSANVEDGKPIKTAKIYYLYDLVDENEHDFNNEFIEIFTSGNELALKLEGFYYLLGYEGATSEGKSFFSLDKLTLKLLNGTEEEFTGTTDFATQSVNFPVLKGEITVKVDDVNNKIKFSSEGAESLITEEFTADQFSTFLTTENKVKVGNTNYEICDTSSTETNQEVVLLCPGTKLLYKNQPDEEIIDNKLFWYLGIVDGKKTIKVSDVEELSGKITFSDWGIFVDKIKEGKSKIYKWKDQLFELTGGDKLESYSLKTIPEGKLYPLQNVKSSVEGLQNGTFVYNEYLLTAKQDWTGDYNIKLNLKPLGYKLLSLAGMNITEKKVGFAYSIEAPLYSLKWDESGSLIKISLNELDSLDAFYSSKFASGTEKDVLLTSGDKLNIKYNMTSTGPLIIIKK